MLLFGRFGSENCRFWTLSVKMLSFSVGTGQKQTTVKPVTCNLQLTTS